MTYRVHRLDVNLDKGVHAIERFLNSLQGEVVGVFPNVQPTFMGMGATARVNCIVVIERLPR